MSLSMRWRLSIGVGAALVVTLLLILVTLRLALGSILGSELDDDLSDDLGQISAQVALAGSSDPEVLQEIVDRFSPGGLLSSSVVVIRSPDGTLLAATNGLDTEAMALTGDQLSRALDGDVVKGDVDLGEEGEVRTRAARLAIGEAVVGVVQVGESTDFINRPLNQLAPILAAEAAGGVILAIIIGYWLARSAVTPVKRVAQVAAEIEASDLSRRIGAEREPAEIQRLADTFDAMLQRLEKAFSQQRGFVMDMSHELRTPLTALRGNIDVMLMDEDLDEDTRAQFERMSAEVARLIRLTSNLLYLAHAEAGRELDRRPVELDVLCLEVCREARVLRPEVDLRLAHEEQAVVTGDRDLLKQLVLNLVDNALKYTPAGGEVTLSLYRDTSQTRIVVTDTGPGIDAEQLPRIFQRLYRGDNGRQRASGAGLGLAISDWIARSHGGEITVESEVGKGSVFTVRLPAQGEPAEPSEADRREVPQADA